MANLKVRVTPGAREDAIVGWQEDVLRVRVRAAAERGKANEALCRLLARKLGMALSTVSVVRGGGSRDKVMAKSMVSKMRTIGGERPTMPS